MNTYRLIWVIVALTLPAFSLQANVLVNGDFNTGDFSGWWTWAADPDNQGGWIEPGDGYAFDGSPSAQLWSASNTPQMTLVQEFIIGENTSYLLSLTYSGRGTAAGSVGISIDYYNAGFTWLDSEWIPLYEQSPAPNTEGHWLSYSGYFTTPAQTANGVIQFRVSDWTTVNLDNVDLSIVPEPATLLLLALGAIALRSKKTL